MDVETLADQGITHILDLREPDEWALPRIGAEAVEAIERNGLHRLNVPVTDMGAPTPQSLDIACRFLEEAVKDETSLVYIHCRAGIERTGAVLVAYYARRHGVSYGAALDQLRKGRPCLAPMPHQERAVRQWLANAALVDRRSTARFHVAH